jgi:LmbE family N-acetylglucosaminyl deacetylase
VNAGAYFGLVDELPIGERRELTEKPVVILSPHPDDESLGTGGLIALARRHLQDVTVISLTDGSGSHPNSRAYPRDQLVHTRRSELAQAARILGLAPDRIVELGLRDTKAPKSGPEFARSAERVGHIVAASGADTLFVTWEHDPHCDHEAAACLAKEIRRCHPGLKLWAYPVWGWHIPADQPVSAPVPAGIRLAIDEVLPQKRAAIAAHVSQLTNLIEDDPDGFRFTETQLAPFLRQFEHYIEVPP